MNLDDRILYIDGEAIIIDKPAGLPVDTPRRGGDSVIARIERGELHLGFKRPPVPMHRLDQDTSGCLLLARNPDARKKIQNSWENGAAVKYYLAVIDAEIAEEDGTIDLPLAKHSTREQGWRMVVDPAGQSALTEWNRVKVKNGRTLVRFEPKTGRTHQLRAHALAAFGAGIVGDPVYGSGNGPMLLHAVRLSIAAGPLSTGYTYHAECPLPGHFGDWRIDAEEVERDRQALMAEFSFRDVSKDTDLGLQNLERPIFDESRYYGYGPYWKFQPQVVDIYFEKGALEPLVRYYQQWTSPDGPEFDRLLQALVSAGRTDLMIKLWQPITRRARAEYYREKPDGNAIERDYAERAKAKALAAYDKAIAWLGKVGAEDEAGAMRAERDDLSAGRLPQLPPVSDSAKMDEALFWDILRQVREQAAEPEERLVLLERLLNVRPAAEIKRFATFYGKAMRQAYHWNVWALAYAAMGGCSDDSFVDFRNWLILEGDPSLIDLAIRDPAAAANRVPRDPAMAEGTLLPMLDEIHLARAGKGFDWPMLDLEKPKGREWDEDRFEEQFPALAAHYAA